VGFARHFSSKHQPGLSIYPKIALRLQTFRRFSSGIGFRFRVLSPPIKRRAAGFIPALRLK
jgi:hypothetical protein